MWLLHVAECENSSRLYQHVLQRGVTRMSRRNASVMTYRSDDRKGQASCSWRVVQRL